MIAIVYVQGHLVGELEFELPNMYDGQPLKVGPADTATLILTEEHQRPGHKPLFLTGRLEYA